ncbi:MAG TPA: hypothetical protein VJT71_18015 [Pyrinomonadaceae bacterium]|nr:hypothetical protein [Pyrinomonadaceae bacterium]
MSRPMRTIFRFVSGFVIGLVLFMWALLLNGAGEGAMTPLVSAAPELLPLLAVFEKSGVWAFWLIVFGAGLLWAGYFGLLPAINSFVSRMVVFMVIAILHFGGGVLALSRDRGFDAEFQRYPVLTVGYFVFFWIVVLSLGALTWAGSKRRVVAAGS